MSFVKRIVALIGMAVLLAAVANRTPAPAADTTLIIQEPHEQWSIRERSGISWLAVSPDGTTVVSGGPQYRPLTAEKTELLPTVRFYDIATQKEKSVLKGMTAGVDGLALSRDGKTLVVYTSDSGRSPPVVTVWDLPSGKSRVLYKGGSLEGAVRCLALSADGKTLATGMWMPAGKHTPIKLWDLPSGKEVASLAAHADMIFSVAFSPDGKTLASGSGVRADRVNFAKGEIKLWDVATRKEKSGLSFAHGRPRFFLAFAPDGTFLAVGAFGSDSIKLWSLPALKEIGTLNAGSHVDCMCFSSDGRYLAAMGGDLTARVWDVPQGVELAMLRTHNVLGVRSLAFAAKDTLLLTATTTEILGWEIRPAANGIGLATPTGQTLPREATDKQVFKQPGTVSSVAYLPDGKTLVCISGGGNIKFWDAATGKEDRALPIVKDMYASAVAANGRLLATGGADKDVHLWDMETGKEKDALKGQPYPIQWLSLSADGKIVVAGSNPQGAKDGRAVAKVWDTTTGKEIASLPHNEGLVGTYEARAVQVSPDGTLVATAGNYDKDADKKVLARSWVHVIRLWDAASGKELAMLKGQTAPVTFSPDGKLLASTAFDREHHVTGQKRAVVVWDVATRKQLLVLRGHLTNVDALQFSPDGKTLATADANGIVKFWDATTGKDLFTLKAHSGAVHTLAFSPNGKLLALGGAGVVVRLTEVPLQR